MSQYLLIDLADHGLRWLTDTGYLIVYIVVLRTALSMKQRVHLRWLIPFLVDAAIQLTYRTMYNIHYVFGMRWSPWDYAFWEVALDVAECTGLCGMIILARWIIEHLRATGSLEKGYLAGDIPASSEAGRWPPPPTSETG